MEADLEVSLLGSLLEEEQGGVGHAEGEYDLICMHVIASLQQTLRPDLCVASPNDQ